MGKFSELIYSLNLSITPCPESGLEIPKPTIRKALDPKSQVSWKNVRTNNLIPGYYVTSTRLFQFLDLLGNGLHKLILVR